MLHAEQGTRASALDSTELASYGLPGPGRYITIYADSAHAFMYAGGLAEQQAAAATRHLHGHESQIAVKCSPSHRILLVGAGGLLLLVNGPLGMANTKDSHPGFTSRLCSLFMSASGGRFPVATAELSDRPAGLRRSRATRGRHGSGSTRSCGRSRCALVLALIVGHGL